NINLECFMPLLMVKDFNSKGFTTSEEFMTNADTPTLAMSGLIRSQINPFTGNPIDSKAKNKPSIVFYAANTNASSGNTFNRGSWFSVKGDPHVLGNWKYIGDH
ncbi:MAG: hypothetical protein Q3987_06260, partial [Oscillospiraceae bacterium]|nr:hypothetical protein [Oscillospiraceae bacterium]